MLPSFNRLKRLRPGAEAVLGGSLVGAPTAGGAMLLARLGFDYLEVDGTRIRPSAASAISLMGRALDLPVIQRVAGIHRAYFGPALEAAPGG